MDKCHKVCFAVSKQVVGFAKYATKICKIHLLVLLGTGLLAGCATLPNGRGWGQEATPFPGWQRIRKAAVGAAIEPNTWIPAAAAAVFKIGNIDENLSDWSADHTPVFGSQKGAKRASDYLRGATGVAYLITAMTTPGGEEPKEWTAAKLKGIAAGAVALSLTHGVTGILKHETDRTRPDSSDDRSFPSGHASTAAAFSTLASRNLESLPISRRNRILLRAGFTTLAAGTAWARIEGKQHYPSDVLAGYAIGHFISAFINDAFLGLGHVNEFGFNFEPSKNGVIVSLRLSY
jgi:membrane-associated phospholipid phosphatase